jgi:sec-independent protein translocase protein TatC
MPAKLKTQEVGLQDTLNRYYPYLLEIRKRLLFIASLFLIAAVFGFFYYEKIVTFILSFLSFQGVNVVFTSPFQFFTLAVNSGIFVGLVIVFPLILYQLLAFLKPALKSKEYRLVVTLLPLSILLFLGGFAFGIAVMRYVVAIFYQKSVELQIGNLLDVELLLSKIVLTGALMGLAFQFPVVMTVLMRLRVIKYKSFIKQRFLAWSSAIIFAALLPPTDILSLVLLTLPLVILFELTLILNRFVLKAHLL